MKTLDQFYALSPRAVKVLSRLGCETINDVAELTEGQLMNAVGCGITVFNNINMVLRTEGLSLSEDEVKIPDAVLAKRALRHIKEAEKILKQLM